MRSSAQVHRRCKGSKERSTVYIQISLHSIHKCGSTVSDSSISSSSESLPFCKICRKAVKFTTCVLIIIFIFSLVAMHQILICLFLVMTIAYALARPDDLAPNVLSEDLASRDKYPAKLDNINVDDILNSDRLLANYHKCLIGDGRCTAEGNEIRSKW